MTCMEWNGRSGRKTLAAAALLSLLTACTLVVDGGGSLRSLTLTSEPAMDGYVFHIPPGSYGGSQWGTPAYIGDDTSNRGHRAVISFPLGALPAGARIETATLRVYQNAARLGAPYELLLAVLVDRVSYSAFIPGPALWSESRGYIGVLASMYRPGTWQELDVTAEARDELEVHGSGRLQFASITRRTRRATPRPTRTAGAWARSRPSRRSWSSPTGSLPRPRLPPPGRGGSFGSGSRMRRLTWACSTIFPRRPGTWRPGRAAGRRSCWFPPCR